MLIAAVVMMGMTGCGPIWEMLGLASPDLTITNVELLKNGEQLTGLRITFKNVGGVDADAQYAVVFSKDTTVSLTNDTVIYKANVSLSAGGEKLVDLDMNQHFKPYIDANNITVAPDTYYLGVFVDPDDLVEEESETNNERASTTPFVIEDDGGGDGGDTTATVSGTVTIDGTAPVGDNLDIGMFSSNADFPYNPAYSATITVSGSSASYSFSDVATGTYVIAATVDVNNTGYLDPGDFGGAYGGIDPVLDAPNANVVAGSNTFNFSIAEISDIGSETVTIGGQMVLSAGLQELDQDGDAVAISSGPYEIHYGFFQGDISDWEPSGSFDPTMLDLYAEMPVNYSDTSGNSLAYSIDIPYYAVGAIVAFMDLNGNGILDLADTGNGEMPMEPISVYPMDIESENGGPRSMYFLEDDLDVELMFYDVTMFMEPMVTVSGDLNLEPGLQQPDPNDYSPYPVSGGTYEVYYGLVPQDLESWTPPNVIDTQVFEVWESDTHQYDDVNGSYYSYDLEVPEGIYGFIFAWMDINDNGMVDVIDTGTGDDFPAEPFIWYPVDWNADGPYSMDFYNDEPDAHLTFLDYTAFGGDSSDDFLEENDSFSEAEDITMYEGDSIYNQEGKDLIQSDPDWYRIDLDPASTTVMIYVWYDQNQGDIGINLFDPYQDWLDGSDGTEGGKYIEFDLSTYDDTSVWLEVYGPGNGQWYDIEWYQDHSSALGIGDIGYDPYSGDLYWSLYNYEDYQGGDYYFAFYMERGWNGSYYEEGFELGWDDGTEFYRIEIPVENSSEYVINLLDNWIFPTSTQFRIEIGGYSYSNSDQYYDYEWADAEFYDYGPSNNQITGTVHVPPGLPAGQLYVGAADSAFLLQQHSELHVDDFPWMDSTYYDGTELNFSYSLNSLPNGIVSVVAFIDTNDDFWLYFDEYGTPTEPVGYKGIGTTEDEGPPPEIIMGPDAVIDYYDFELLGSGAVEPGSATFGIQ